MLPLPRKRDSMQNNPHSRREREIFPAFLGKVRKEVPLRDIFPRWVKALAAVVQFPAKVQSFRQCQFRPLRRSRASSPKGGAKP